MKKIFENKFFSDKAIPPWPCPTCSEGTLLLDGKFNVHNDSHTEQYRNDEFFEPEMGKYVFSCTMKCNLCKEAVSVSGTGGSEPGWDEEYPNATVYYDFYTPTFFQPALPIIGIPDSDEFSPKVRSMLEKSFLLFWCDYDACANRIRATLEVLLDAMNIPRRMGDTQKKDMSLHDRIDKIDASSGPDLAEVKKLIMAVKWLGNAATHEPEALDRDELILGYKMLELCLQRIYKQTDHMAILMQAQGIIDKNTKKQGL